MKETIYTIPVNEAFDRNTECAVCELEKDLEMSNIGFVTGPALMESDVRIEMNKKGFCRRHYAALVGSQKNSLGLSLILTSHHEVRMEEIRKKTAGIYKAAEKELKKQNRFKSSAELAAALAQLLKKDLSACFICDRISLTMDKYLDVILHMWKTDTGFRQKFSEAKGFCNDHTRMLLEYGAKNLKNDELAGFVSMMYSIFMASWERNEKDLRWFTKKFDYRYNDEPWYDSKDAVSRIAQKNAGFIEQPFQK